MIEVATLKSIVDLFKQLLSIVNGRAKARRDSFDRTFKPLYDRMEIVAKDYYAAVSKTASQLNDPSPDYRKILKELEASRAAIAIARNGVLGESQAFLNKYGARSDRTLTGDRLNKLAYNFANNLCHYFYDSERAFAFAPEGTTRMTGLLISLKDLSERPQNKKFYRAIASDAQRQANRAVVSLEHCWTEVSKAYAELKLVCGG
jgi:hypothetical protein